MESGVSDVFMVVRGYYDQVIAVFSTETLAEAYIARFDQVSRYDKGELRIDQRQLDRPVPTEGPIWVTAYDDTVYYEPDPEEKDDGDNEGQGA
jgi:hypothetical protein